MLRYSLILIFLFLFPSLAGAATYYVRSAGSTNTNCLGTTNADYDGSGTGEACALNHPEWFAPMEANSTASESTVNVDNDTLVIVNGSYRMGCKDAVDCVDTTYNSTTGGDCYQLASYDCDPRPLNDGVTIIGCTTSGCSCTYGWGGVTTCSTTRPELWGAGNTQEVIDVSGSTGVTIKDIEITDHANCNLFTPFTCRNAGDMSNPTSLSAQWGINATSATNLTLTGVNNHGVGYESMRVKNVNGMTITGSNFDYAVTGMNNDDTGSCTTCGLSGTITIDRSSMNGHGCIEDWQNDGSIVDNTCCSQTQGCSSADAIGFGNTGGTWVITDSDMSYNTADGPDFLYLNRGIYSGGSLTVQRSRVEGNAGNTFKGPNAMYIGSSFGLSNCGYFANQTFTNYDKAQAARSGTACDNDAVCDSNENSLDCGWDDSVGGGGDGDGIIDAGEGDCPVFDHCRSNTGGMAIEFKSGDATTPEFYNNTFSSNGDVHLLTSGTCTTGIDVIAQGNIFLGGIQWNDDNENPYVGTGGDGQVSIYYEDGGTCNPDFVEDYNLFVGDFQEADPHTGANSVYEITMSDVFSGTALQGPYSSPGYYTGQDYNNVLYLNATSTALNMSNEVGDEADDFNTFARGAAWDGGAVEYGSEVQGGGRATAVGRATASGRNAAVSRATASGRINAQ